MEERASADKKVTERGRRGRKGVDVRRSKLDGGERLPFFFFLINQCFPFAGEGRDLDPMVQISGNNTNADNEVPDHLADLLVANKYRLVRKIGSGSFGEIYLGMIQISAMTAGFEFSVSLLYDAMPSESAVAIRIVRGSRAARSSF